jgi:hypothetical protein
MEDKIESLALEKNFAALSPAERALVLAEMPQAEFEHLRAVLLAARHLEARALPPAALRERLLEKMAMQTNPGLLRRTLAVRLPAWQAAAALVLGVAAVWFLKKENLREKFVTQTQLRTDTIFVEKTCWRERVQWRERVVFREKPAAAPMVFLSEKIDSQGVRFELAPPHVGTSLGDAPELLDFFTQGDR